MDGYYTNYLNNSDCYKNSLSAKEKLDVIKASFDELKNEFKNASGNVIDEINKDLADLEKDLDGYITKLSTAKEKFEANASKFDKALNEWNGKINQDFKEPEIRPGIQSKDAHLAPPMYYEKISKVGINDKGYISITVKKYIVAEVIYPGENKKSKVTNDCGFSVYEYQFTNSKLLECK